MDFVLLKLNSNNNEEISNALQEFTKKISDKFIFPELDEYEYRVGLWKVLYDILANKSFKEFHKQCLQIIRIISREKKNLNDVATKEYLNLILCHAGLIENKSIVEPPSHEIAIEALMCLCNITYNGSMPRMICCRNGTLERIIKRLHTNRDVSTDMKYFDMKILFIITALCNEARTTVREKLHGLTYLIDTLDIIIKELNESNHNADVTGELLKLSDPNVNLSIEILKILFNITMRPQLKDIVDEEEEAHFLRLITVLRGYLLVDTYDSKKKLELDGHITHLLLNVPDHCVNSLLTPVHSGQVIPSTMRYGEHDMSAIYEILIYLRSRFTPEPSVTHQNEILSPALSGMVKLAKSNRLIRKYLRVQILPPLRDIHTRPEQGNTIRNCLCRLLTSPITQVRDLAADFLFVLCKENVRRMIKYTGYGNAAGMFASRGLLNGNNGNTEKYSSDSQDSETEEYTEFKHGINPVIGCYQEPKPSPTAHMTEEQKEHEAMKLVELMDSLTKKGVVRPCRINAEGKPEPIEHVLQLQENLNTLHLGSDDEMEMNET